MYSIIFEITENITDDLAEALGFYQFNWSLENGNYLILLPSIELKKLNRVLVIFGLKMKTYRIFKDNQLVDFYNWYTENQKDIEF